MTKGRKNGNTRAALASANARSAAEVARSAGLTIEAIRTRISRGVRGPALTAGRMVAPGRSLREIAKLTGYDGSYAKRLCAGVGVDVRLASREEIARALREHERALRERRVKRAKAARKAPRRRAGPTVKQLARSVGKSKGAIYRRAEKHGVTFLDVIRDLTAHPSLRVLRRAGRPMLSLDGALVTRTEMARALGVTLATVDMWRARSGGIEHLIAKCRAGQHEDVSRKRGRPATRIAVGGVSEPLAYWCNRLGMGREGLWSAAKKRGLTTAQEIARRVALESQEVAA